jgi:hypothetical protein
MLLHLLLLLLLHPLILRLLLLNIYTWLHVYPLPYLPLLIARVQTTKLQTLHLLLCNPVLLLYFSLAQLLLLFSFPYNSSVVHVVWSCTVI